METVTIPKKEYERLKKASKIDKQLVDQIKKSFEDVKNGRVKEWKHIS